MGLRSVRTSGPAFGFGTQRRVVLVGAIVGLLLPGAERVSGARPRKSAKSLPVAQNTFQVRAHGKVLQVTRSRRHYHTFSFSSPIAKVHPNPRLPYVALFFASKGGTTTSVVIVDLTNRKTAPYRPGKRKYVDLPVYRRETSPWSVRGSFIALPVTSHGPIHVVATRQLVAYLAGKTSPYRIVQYKTTPDKSSQVHWLHRWKTDHVLVFDHACCGSSWRSRYNVRSRRYRGNRCVSGRSRQSRSPKR